MKRKIFIALTLACCIFCTSIFSACAEIGGLFGDLFGDDFFGDLGIHFHKYDTEWSSDDEYHWHACLRDNCSEPEKDKTAHSDSDKDGECDVCGHAVPLPHEHDYRWIIHEEEGTHEQYCEVEDCPAPYINYGPHYFELDGYCVCGAEAEASGHEHSLSEVSAKAPTCTQKGYEAHCTCSGCALIFSDMSGQKVIEMPWIKASGHQPGKNGVCIVCGNLDWTSEGLDFIELSKSDYGYNYLGTLYNGKKRQALYDKIDEAVKAVHNNESTNYTQDKAFATISFDGMGLNTDDALAVWKTYNDDNPLYYWFSNKIGYRTNELGYNENTLLLYIDNDFVKGSERAKYNKIIFNGIKEYIEMVDGETSAYQIALAFHDKIIDTIDYSYNKSGKPETAKWAHSIAGVFNEQGAVCEGYAKTFQLLLNIRGIENLMVDGYAGDGVGGNGAHAWNLIKLDDDEWYWCDLTWDDAPNYAWGIYYGYFCVNDAQAVNWADGANQDGTEEGDNCIGGDAHGSHNFLTGHIANNPGKAGLDFLYELPARSSHPYTGVGDELLLRDTFEVGDYEYAVAGYAAVQVTRVPTEGAVTISESVTYAEKDYTVMAIGAVGGTKLFGAGYIFERDVTSVSLPATIKFIWGAVFYRCTVDTINFSGTKTQWRDGIGKANYWKNDNKPLTIQCKDGAITA